MGRIRARVTIESNPVHSYGGFGLQGRSGSCGARIGESKAHQRTRHSSEGTRAHDAARVAPPQLPTIFRRPAYFTCRNVDAERGAGVAGVSPDGIIAAAGRCGLRIANSHFSA